MKKRCFFICFLLVAIFIMSGCSNQKEIKSIIINGEKYQSIYLYSFKNADISDKYSVITETPVEFPSHNGYVLTEGIRNNTVEVWEQYFFKREPEKSTFTTADLVTESEIEDLLEEFPISVKKNKYTYIITYYDFDYSTDTDRERLINESLVKNVIETSIDNIVIEYFE